MSDMTPADGRFIETPFVDSDLPSLFQASDRVAGSAQRLYNLFVSLDLLLLVVVAALGLEVFRGMEWIAIVRAVLLSGGLLLATALATKRPDREWHDARWVAETAKSQAWRYLCGDGRSEEEFLNGLDALMNEKEYLAAGLAISSATRPLVTARMMEILAQSTLIRRDLYLTQRLGEQQSWYIRKAAANRTSENLWYSAVVACQFAAAAWAIYLIPHPNRPNIIELFTISTTACLSWVQLKQFQQLAQSYGRAAQQLGHLAQAGKHVVSDEELKEFVEKSEQVMSGENSDWYARHHDTRE